MLIIKKNNSILYLLRLNQIRIKLTFYIIGVFKMIYEHNKLFIEMIEF